MTPGKAKYLLEVATRTHAVRVDPALAVFSCFCRIHAVRVELDRSLVREDEVGMPGDKELGTFTQEERVEGRGKGMRAVSARTKPEQAR